MMSVGSAIHLCKVVSDGGNGLDMSRAVMHERNEISVTSDSGRDVTTDLSRGGDGNRTRF